MKKILSLALCIAAACLCTAQNVTDLSGSWEFEIDRNDTGKSENWQNRKLADNIILPASMPQRLKGDDISVDTKWVGSLYDSSYFYNPYLKKYRQPGNMKLTFFLTPDKHFVGTAWYRKTVSLPKIDTEKKRYVLYLERPHIQSTVFVNGQEAGTDRSLCVPHEFDVTRFLKKGDNTIAVRIDNRIETVGVGQDSHSVTDQTQGDWNGIVGRMELREIPALSVADVQVFPDVDNKQAHVKVALQGPITKKARLLLLAKSFNGKYVHTALKSVNLEKEDEGKTIETDFNLGENMQLWDEFHPNLYRLYATVVDASDKSAKVLLKDKLDFQSDQFVSLLKQHYAFETVFGMRKFEIKGRMFFVNGRETQLRGTVENCDFPLTGYAPMGVDEWMNVFKACKRYGLNHMRFHSYCPPEAAFLAADMTGFYIQPEGPSWPNHGVKLGYGQDIDTFLMEETQRISKVYGNHPSFCMLACGNEPAGRWVEWVSKFVDYWKQTDSRRVYTGASVGGGWAWQPKSQYHVKAGARGLDWASRAPQAMDDYTQKITHYKAKDMETDIHEPYVSHETGQWCVFPNFEETKKYTGVNKARNFEVFQDILNDHKMGSMARKFFLASGKLQALCYKYEIERTMRTPDYAGFQLLGLNDYSGQGTALVGVTDVFFDQKDYIDSDEWRQFCAPVVLLARIPKFTYANDEHFKAEILLNQFGEAALDNAEVRYTLQTLSGEQFPSVGQRTDYENIKEGTVAKKSFPVGDVQTVGNIDIPLSGITTPVHLRLNVEIKGTDIENHWDFWVYPQKVETAENGIYITDQLDAKAITTLQNGGKVLICAGKNVKYGNDIVQQFLPVFWNTSWFKMRPPHTTGLYIDNSHPALAAFPTDYYSDLQWWELTDKTPVMQFDEFPDSFQPIVQSIDTWFLSRKIGMLFEANVLNGKLMMTTMDITTDLDRRIAARQMRVSILNYMNSDQFQPSMNISQQVISNLFTKTAPKVDMFTNDSPDELKPKLK